MSVIGKGFNNVLNVRLLEWAEMQSMLYEEQTGFRKGRSCADQMFVLQSLVQTYLSRSKGRFYCLFIDFKKAFNSVPHNFLWFKLINDGVHGRILHVIQSLYQQFSSKYSV
jgi:hypothetical protein